VAVQQRYYGRAQRNDETTPPDALDAEKVTFIARRDNFYLATITNNDWPYIQHRNDPANFLKIIDAQTVGFADLRENRQLVSTNNLTSADRVTMFLMDYPRRQRLKILGCARAVDARQE